MDLRAHTVARTHIWLDGARRPSAAAGLGPRKAQARPWVSGADYSGG